jgi:hypothetical protein
MTKRFLTGILFIILGLLVAIGPQTLFSVCGAHDGKFMKCHWTAQAELGIGFIVAILGLLLILIASRQFRIGISIGIFLNAILVLLIPNILIGVCGSLHMNCRILTLPALNILGVLIALIAVINIWFLWNKDRKEESV